MLMDGIDIGLIESVAFDKGVEDPTVNSPAHPTVVNSFECWTVNSFDCRNVDSFECWTASS
jgi:hypothetical protein